MQFFLAQLSFHTPFIVFYFFIEVEQNGTFHVPGFKYKLIQLTLTLLNYTALYHNKESTQSGRIEKKEKKTFE